MGQDDTLGRSRYLPTASPMLLALAKVYNTQKPDSCGVGLLCERGLAPVYFIVKFFMRLYGRWAYL